MLWNVTTNQNRTQRKRRNLYFSPSPGFKLRALAPEADGIPVCYHASNIFAKVFFQKQLKKIINKTKGVSVAHW